MALRITAAIWDHYAQAHPHTIRARLDDGVVELAGVVNDARNRIGTVINVLAAPMRPDRTLLAWASGQFTGVTVDPDGTVTLVGAPWGRASLAGIRFPVRLT